MANDPRVVAQVAAMIGPQPKPEAPEAPPSPPQEETTQHAEEERREDVSEAVAESGAEGEVEATDSEAETEEQTDAGPVTYTIADLAEATGLPADKVGEHLMVEVGRDGKTEQKTLAEILKGYNWNDALTQESQKVAEKRKLAESSITAAQELEAQARMVFDSQLQSIKAEADALEQQYNQIDWAAVQQQGQGALADQRAMFEEARRKLGQRWQAVEQQRGQLAQKRTATQQEWRQQNAPRLEAELLGMVPEWQDATVRSDETGRVVRYLTEQAGFSEQDIEAVQWNPRAVQVARDAMLYRAGQAAESKAREVVREKVTKLPTIKSLRPGQAGGQANARVQERQRKMARVQQTGNARDLAALIRSR